MKTIEITSKVKSKRKLLKKLYHDFLNRDPNWHYFIEPNLIIRTSKVKEITGYLKFKKLDYLVYPYPYTHSKKQYGESKRYAYLQDMSEKLYHIQAVFVTTTKSKDSHYFINRFNHCVLNMAGYDFYEESLYYINSAYGYMRHQYHKDRKISTFISAILIKWLYKLLD
jgi:hypothetical protein